MTSALRGEGVPSKADIVSNLSKGGCVNLRTRGEEFKKSEIFAAVINESPLRSSVIIAMPQRVCLASQICRCFRYHRLKLIPLQEGR